MERHKGFTLIELLTAIAVAATLAAWSIPSFRDARLNAARTREVNQFVQAVYFARSEAMKRNGVVSLCPSVDTTTCAPDGTRWDRGWIVFANVDRESPPRRDDDEELLRTYAGWDVGRIIANRDTLSFRAFGQSGVTATFAYCDARGGAAARAVIISQTGRPRVSDRSASGSALSCQ
jgi:type IV fimbrial biogenesis protein FimT